MKLDSRPIYGIDINIKHKHCKYEEGIDLGVKNASWLIKNNIYDKCA